MLEPIVCINTWVLKNKVRTNSLFLGFCSFESGLVCFFSRQALFCEYIIPRCIFDAFVHKMCFFIKEVSYAES
jgi:hypothetical protein